MSISISLFIADFINNILLSIYSLESYKEKNRYFYIKYFLVITIVTIVTNIMIKSAPQIAKTTIKLLLLSALIRIISGESFSKILMEVFLISIVFMFLDCLYGMIYIGILKFSPQAYQNSWSGILIANFIMAIIGLIIISRKKIKEFIKHIAYLYSNKATVNLIGNVILCIVSIWFFIQRNTMGITPLYDYIMNFVVIVAIIVFVIGFFKENSDKNQIKREYDSLLDYAKIYEQEVVEKSKWQHEYENQLIIIKDKISSRNKEAREYINQLLKNKPVDINSQWLGKLSKFPDIGIKGLLCYKIGQMQTKGISVFVDISENIKITKLHKEILEKNLQDISRVFGVYIDNAADAAYESINKYFVFEFYCTNDTLVFQISNTFAGSLDLQKMGTEKFTTKGKGHGYGLSLVKDILEKNVSLYQEREINGMYYVQRLIVNTKK